MITTQVTPTHATHFPTVITENCAETGKLKTNGTIGLNFFDFRDYPATSPGRVTAPSI